LATSKITNEQVALKRIPDVLQSTDNAKKVLRELCILRRLSHPYCISLKHAFVMPSDTGRWKFRNGELIPCSIDLYLAMEYAGGGDLHKLRGQLSEHDVRRLMWQILTAVEYLHSQHVWHRDLKTANVLLTVENGQRVCKIADFGSARSASSQPLHRESDLVTHQRQHTADGDFLGVCPKDNSIENQSLTHRVCTPCYRAPEVVMSRGGYTSALDMWSVGCIFAELLQRLSYVGSAATPQLRVSPVFCITGFPKTPSSGDRYEAGPGNVTTRTELEALFQVIGTPAWACIEAVDSTAWKKYLRNLPLKAGTLHRRFGYAGEVAVDLLTRLLTFDPSRRCSAREAMFHEYFKQYWAPLKDDLSPSDEGELTSTSSLFDTMDEMDLDDTQGDVRYHEIENPARALKVLEEEMLQICTDSTGCEELQSLLVKECEMLAQSQSRKLGTHMSGKYESVTNALARKCMREGPSDFVNLLREGLEEDPNSDKTMKPDSLGIGRLPHVADFSKACLDVEKHLAVGRQQEWTPVSGCGPVTINFWGVSLVPPGFDEATADPKMRQVIQNQQQR